MAYDNIEIPNRNMPYILSNLARIDFQGLPEYSIIYEQSPRLVGLRAVGITYKPRFGSMVVNVQKSDKKDFLNIFNPSRYFALEQPFVYNTYTEGGEKVYGHDASLIAGSKLVSSATGKFKDFGGLRDGDFIILDGTTFQIEEVLSDTLLLLTCTIYNTVSDIDWSYTRGISRRRLDFNINNGGMKFIRTSSDNCFTQEVVNIVAPFPFWYGEKQSIKGITVGLLDDKSYPVQYPEGNIYDKKEPISNLSITLHSDLYVRPTITLFGRSTRFKLTNESNDTTIEYTRYISPSQVVIIELEAMTATEYPSQQDADNNTNGVNVFRYVTGDRSIFGFDPNFVNEVVIETDSVRDVFADITWYNKYLGS